MFPHVQLEPTWQTSSIYRASGQCVLGPTKERELLYVILFRLNLFCDQFTAKLGAGDMQVIVGEAITGVWSSSVWHTWSQPERQGRRTVMGPLHDKRFSSPWPVLRGTMLRLQDKKVSAELKRVQKSSDTLVFHLESKPPKEQHRNHPPRPPQECILPHELLRARNTHVATQRHVL